MASNQQGGGLPTSIRNFDIQGALNSVDFLDNGLAVAKFDGKKLLSMLMQGVYENDPNAVPINITRVSSTPERLMIYGIPKSFTPDRMVESMEVKIVIKMVSLYDGIMKAMPNLRDIKVMNTADNVIIAFYIPKEQIEAMLKQRMGDNATLPGLGQSERKEDDSW